MLLRESTYRAEFIGGPHDGLVLQVIQPARQYWLAHPRDANDPRKDVRYDRVECGEEGCVYVVRG